MTDPCASCALAPRPGCDERGWLVSPGTNAAARCPNYLKATGERRVVLAGIPERFAEARLQGFEHKGLAGERQLKAARSACLEFIKKPERGLLLWGGPGAGKTHLLAATLRGVLLGHPALTGRFVEFTQLCARLSSSYDQPVEGEEEGPRETERSILAPLGACSVLGLDELGLRRPSPFVSDTLYLIINGLYNRRGLLLAATNYDPNGTGRGSLEERLAEPRILSRIHEMCDILPLNRAGDYRKRRVDTETQP